MKKTTKTMKKHYLMNSYLYEAWKKAGLNDEDAKQAAIESARTDVTIGALNQSMVELRSHVDTSLMGLRGEMTSLCSHVDTSLMGLCGEMTSLCSHVDTSLTGLRGEMAELRGDLRVDIKKSQIQMIGFMLTGFVLMTGVISVLLLNT